MAMSNKAVRAFGKLERALTELREALEAEDEPFAGDARWRRMLTLVEERGGRVSRSEWSALGKQVGYDPRGLGGFYVGANASMRRNKATDERVMTAAGRRYLNKYGRLH